RLAATHLELHDSRAPRATRAHTSGAIATHSAHASKFWPVHDAPPADRYANLGASSGTQQAEQRDPGNAVFSRFLVTAVPRPLDSVHGFAACFAAYGFSAHDFSASGFAVRDGFA